jgi:hypothetical protein
MREETVVARTRQTKLGVPLNFSKYKKGMVLMDYQPILHQINIVKKETTV